MNEKALFLPPSLKLSDFEVVYLSFWKHDNRYPKPDKEIIRKLAQGRENGN